MAYIRKTKDADDKDRYIKISVSGEYVEIEVHGFVREEAVIYLRGAANSIAHDGGGDVTGDVEDILSSIGGNV